MVRPLGAGEFGHKQGCYIEAEEKIRKKMQ